jgi:uncharacterized protein YqeY
MLDVNNYLIKVMKKQIFSDTDLMNKSAKQVLAELKTKYVDIKEEITAPLQFKLLTKMLNDRSKAADIYNNAGRTDLEEKERSEMFVISSLIKELEEFLPKQMSEKEITDKISEIISTNSSTNIGIIMKAFKDLPADKALVSKIAKEMLSL